MKKLFNILSSVKITVACLFLLFVLTFWGTVAQTTQGLYVAQERFFHSFFFLAGGWLPFPGAQLVLWVLFVNLVFSAITHFSRLRHWRYAGLKMSHAGLLLYFAAAYITFHVTEESNLHLAEGEGSNISSSYHEWELAYWKEEGNTRHVTAFDAKNFKPGYVVNVPDAKVNVEQFFLNSTAFTKTLPADGIKPLNDSGITLLQPKDLLKEREKNMAGGVFNINGQRVLLFGAESTPTKVGDYYFSLRHKKYVLPFTLKLDDVKAEFHPGTKIAKSYESHVTMVLPDAQRQVRIFMNNPLRHKDYTFYQASYEIDAMGREYTTLAVVKNFGWVLPYIACFAVFFGLVAHFLIKAFEKRLKK